MNMSGAGSCITLWLSSYVANVIWLCGFVAISSVASWLCGYVAMRQCGYVAVSLRATWLCGYVSIWLYYGCVTLWLCGSVALWLCVYVAVLNFVPIPRSGDAYQRPGPRGVLSINNFFSVPLDVSYCVTDLW